MYFRLKGTEGKRDKVLQERALDIVPAIQENNAKTHRGIECTIGVPVSAPAAVHDGNGKRNPKSWI
jgi:hypothetical protein